MTAYEDIIYEERLKGVARITINRPASYSTLTSRRFPETAYRQTFVSAVLRRSSSR